jgi:DNA gyrase inhibitor GyrI
MGVYQTLQGDWPGESGRQPDMTRPCFERHLDNPREVKSEDIRTEIYVPLLG